MNTAHKTIRAVIIDDEKTARDTLKQLLQIYCPQVLLVGEANDVEPGQNLIRELNPDLVFLDVEMHSGTGFDVINGLDNIQAEVIFTTAHNHYALHAIRVSALDYLLKPVSSEELIIAVDKCKPGQLNIPREVWELLRVQLDSQKSNPDRLSIPTTKGYEIIKVKDIIYCEGDRNYTVFYFHEKEKLLSSRTLKEYEHLLPPKSFIRVHQKYLVNINFVKRYIKGRGGFLIMSNEKEIEVSQSKKQELMDLLQ
jgi:two-component system, LytTR family, response regulator